MYVRLQLYSIVTKTREAVPDGGENALGRVPCPESEQLSACPLTQQRSLVSPRTHETS